MLRARYTLLHRPKSGAGAPLAVQRRLVFTVSNGMEEADISFRRSAMRTHPAGRATRSASVETPKVTPASALVDVDDGTLLALVGQGDENAMGALFDRYSRVVYSVALRVLRDPSAAEDVLQEVFMQVWRKPEAMVVNRATIGAWLAVVARNRSIDALRRRKPSESVEEVVLPSGVDVAGDAERNYTMERARAVMARMPVEQRKTLEMAFFDGLTHSEIADTTGDPLGTVKSRIRTALLLLRKALTA